MKEFLSRHLRSCRKVTDQFVFGFFLSFLLTGLGQLLGIIISNRIINPVYGSIEASPDYIQTGSLYGEFIGIWILLILVMLLGKNRPMLKAFGTKLSGNTPKMALFGCLIGFGANMLCAVFSLLNHDIALYFYDFDIVIFLFLLLMVFIQSAAEEIVMRNYYYEKLRRRYRNPLIPLCLTAVGFSVMHVGNPNMTTWGLIQVVAIGLLLSVLVHYYNSLWAAFWVHAAWNFTQSILLGLPNSGLVVPYSIFKIDAAANGFFFDAGNGIEGSPGACIVIGIITVLLIVYAKKKNLHPHDLWAEQEAAQDALIAEKEQNLQKLQ